MKVKLKQVLEGETALAKLSEMKLPIKVSYRIKRIIDKVIPEIKAYNEKRNELFEELGKENEDKTRSILPENLETFRAKIKELEEVEVELNFEKIKLTDLGDAMYIEPNLLVDFVFSEN